MFDNDPRGFDNSGFPSEKKPLNQTPKWQQWYVQLEDSSRANIVRKPRHERLWQFLVTQVLSALEIPAMFFVGNHLQINTLW